MGMMENMKMASDMMKNMSPEQMDQLMKQAKESKTQMDEDIRKIVREEIASMGLVSRDEVEKMIADKK